MQRSRLRVGVILILSLMIWVGLYGLFAEGFVFLRNLETTVPVSHRIIELLFGAFFLSLTGLMVFSTGIVLYGSLFRAAEAGFLLTTPARPDHIFAYKLQEALFFSGWAFLLLGTPLLVAYGIEMSAAWPYYAMLLPYLLGFLLLPGSLGALFCLLLVHYFPQRRGQALGALFLLLLAAALAWLASLARDAPTEAISEAWLRRLIDHLKPGQLPFLPSRWMTSGLMAAARGRPGDVGEALFSLLLVWSNALFFYLLAAVLAGRVYRSAYDRVTSTGRRGDRKYGDHWSDRLVNAALAWSDYRTRTFVIKDLRTFRRDPVQWAQVVILGGILLVYFLFIPRLPHGQYALYQRTFIGLLNIVVIGLMLATYTSRFVFPMMSLEGRNFWVLGLLPLRRDRLVTSKFAYAATVTVTFSLGLALLSELMLGLPWAIVLIHLFAMLVLAFGLSAISVGLGAYLINLKESNPSKIATGFGGTINLLASLVFSVVAVLLAGVPTFIYFANRELREQEIIVIDYLQFWLVVSLGLLALLGLVAVIVPLRLGIRAFRTTEF